MNAMNEDLQTDENLSEGAKKLLGSLKVAPAWRDVCKAFENKRMCKRHPTWAQTLRRCAVFQVDDVFLDSAFLEWGDGLAGGETVTAPLAFPEIAVLSKNRFFVARDFWYHEEKQIAGVSILTAFTLDLFKQEKVIWYYTGEILVDLLAWTSPVGKPEFEKDVLHVDDCANTLTKNGKPFTKPKDDSVGFETLIAGFGALLAFQRHIHQPAHFIVTCAPSKTGRLLPGQIPRLHSRPQHLVIDKDSIATRFANANPDKHRSPMPHLRRGHYRTLAANRYKEPGKRVWVRATHVKGNTVEWREGDRHYKVL